MTTFLNGPVHNQELELRNTPLALRVVIDPDGKWDALDLSADSVYPNESIHLYVLEGHAHTGKVRYVDSTGTKKVKAVSVATYRYAEIQPTDADMRKSGTWQKWLLTNKRRLWAAHDATLPGIEKIGATV